MRHSIRMFEKLLVTGKMSERQKFMIRDMLQTIKYLKDKLEYVERQLKFGATNGGLSEGECIFVCKRLKDGLDQ